MSPSYAKLALTAMWRIHDYNEKHSSEDSYNFNSQRNTVVTLSFFFLVSFFPLRFEEKTRVQQRNLSHWFLLCLQLSIDKIGHWTFITSFLSLLPISYLWLLFKMLLKVDLLPQPCTSIPTPSGQSIKPVYFSIQHYSLHKLWYNLRTVYW